MKAKREMKKRYRRKETEKKIEERRKDIERNI